MTQTQPTRQNPRRPMSTDPGRTEMYLAKIVGDADHGLASKLHAAIDANTDRSERASHLHGLQSALMDIAGRNMPRGREALRSYARQYRVGR